MSMTNYLEDKILNHIAGKEEFTSPDSLFIALSKEEITEEGQIIEVDSESYERQQIIFSKSENGTIKNTQDVVFPIATDNWGIIKSVAIFDSLTSGNILFYTKLLKEQDVIQDNQIIFKAEKLTIQLD